MTKKASETLREWNSYVPGNNRFVEWPIELMAGKSVKKSNGSDARTSDRGTSESNNKNNCRTERS